MPYSGSVVKHMVEDQKGKSLEAKVMKEIHGVRPFFFACRRAGHVEGLLLRGTAPYPGVWDRMHTDFVGKTFKIKF